MISGMLPFLVIYWCWECGV